MNNTVLYITTVLIWGSTWLAIVFQLGTVAAEVSVFYRYALASTLLLLWCKIRGLPMRFNRQAHGRFVLLGLFLFGLNYIFAYHGQKYITSALMAIMFSTLLWMNIVNARLFFNIKADKKVIVGAILGVFGVALMFWPAISGFTLQDATVIGALFGLGGTFAASLGNMASLSAQKLNLPVVQSNAWGMLYGALFTGSVALFSGHSFTFDWSLPYVASLVYLAVFGSIIAFGAYLTLLGRIGAHRAGYANVLFPVVALTLSVLFEDFVMSPLVMVGIGMVLLGNLLVMRRSIK